MTPGNSPVLLILWRDNKRKLEEKIYSVALHLRSIWGGINVTLVYNLCSIIEDIFQMSTHSFSCQSIEDFGKHAACLYCLIQFHWTVRSSLKRSCLDDVHLMVPSNVIRPNSIIDHQIFSSFHRLPMIVQTRRQTSMIYALVLRRKTKIDLWAMIFFEDNSEKSAMIEGHLYLFPLSVCILIPLAYFLS